MNEKNETSHFNFKRVKSEHTRRKRQHSKNNKKKINNNNQSPKTKQHD
jgi:hypothetical protein